MLTRAMLGARRPGRMRTMVLIDPTDASDLGSSAEDEEDRGRDSYCRHAKVDGRKGSIE